MRNKKAGLPYWQARFTFNALLRRRARSKPVTPRDRSDPTGSKKPPNRRLDSAERCPRRTTARERIPCAPQLGRSAVVLHGKSSNGFNRSALCESLSWRDFLRERANRGALSPNAREQTKSFPSKFPATVATTDQIGIGSNSRLFLKLEYPLPALPPQASPPLPSRLVPPLLRSPRASRVRRRVP